MSDISQLMKQQAEQMRGEVSPSDNSWDLIKAAAVEQLQAEGVTDAEKLLEELAKKAGYGETQSVANSFSFDTEEVASLIEKSASYIEELEAKIESNEDTISGLHEELEKASSINHEDIVNSLVEKGFSDEEANNLATLPEDTLNKVASMANGEPWEMGQGGRQAEDGMDPFTKFLLS